MTAKETYEKLYRKYKIKAHDENKLITEDKASRYANKLAVKNTWKEFNKNFMEKKDI